MSFRKCFGWKRVSFLARRNSIDAGVPCVAQVGPHWFSNVSFFFFKSILVFVLFFFFFCRGRIQDQRARQLVDQRLAAARHRHPRTRTRPRARPRIPRSRSVRTGFYWVLPSFTGFYLVLLNFSGFQRFFPTACPLYWVLPGFT